MDSLDWTQLAVLSFFGVGMVSIIVFVAIAYQIGKKQSRSLADINDSLQQLIALLRERR